MRRTSTRRTTMRRNRSTFFSEPTGEPVDTALYKTVPTGEKEVPCPACELMIPSGVRMWWFHIGTDKTCSAYNREALTWLKR